MAGITLEKGKAIYTYGQPMSALHLIVSGKIRVDYPGGFYLLGKGDVIGICEINSEIHFLSYTVEEAATLATYPLSGNKVLDELLRQRIDVARYFLLSACRQIHTLKNRRSLSAVNCNTLYRNLMEDWEKYTSICERYRITPQKPNGMQELSAFLEEESDTFVANGFYLGLMHIYAGDQCKVFLKEAAVSLGILTRANSEFQEIWSNLDEQFKYQQQIGELYFNESGCDLFNCYTSLYNKLDPNAEERSHLVETIERMGAQFNGNPAVSAKLLAQRTDQFQSILAVAASSDMAAEQDDPVLLPELSGSLDAILEFAGKDLEIADSFRKHIYAFRQEPEKNSMEQSVCALRRVLTEEFYILYSAVFEHSLNKHKLPMPVKMFLYFGYVDEQLAGAGNAAALLQIASSVTDASEFGLYTFYDWLMAIFKGKKEPSRNEFDQDYTDYLHKQKFSGNLTEAEMMNLERSGMGKVNFELQNLFPAVNKITFGRISTYCPVFIAENALRDLSSSQVTVSKIAKAMELIRKVDYSAFYRAGLDMNHIDVLGKTPIHTECLPDIILMPNTGIRSVMWQEIEGRKRNTPARMIFPFFHMEDVSTSFLRLTAEFRWEICKRIQGGRWNDISEPSLTSEYFDYVQFYRKNHDLSNEAKERIRTSLMQTKNSFKEMFVRDYMSWILFEGNASPRLNKVARKIMFTYCPFSAEICAVVEQNPLYSELLQRHKIKRAQQLHQLNMLKQKLRNANTPVPDTLEQECQYFQL